LGYRTKVKTWNQNNFGNNTNDKNKKQDNLPDLQAKLRTEKLITNKEKIDLRDALIVAFDGTRSEPLM
jgi:hypothetical protein